MLALEQLAGKDDLLAPGSSDRSDLPWLRACLLRIIYSYISAQKRSHVNIKNRYCESDSTSQDEALIAAQKVKKQEGQSNLTKSASRGAHSPVRGHPRGSKFVPLNSWGRGSY